MVLTIRKKNPTESTALVGRNELIQCRDRSVVYEITPSNGELN